MKIETEIIASIAARPIVLNHEEPVLKGNEPCIYRKTETSRSRRDWNNNEAKTTITKRLS